MSIIASVDLKVAPTAAALTTVTAGGGGSTWANGNYVEFVAATGAAAVGLGITTNAGSTSGLMAEIDIATGAAASEVVLGTVRVKIGNPGAAGPGTFLLPIPLAGIANGGRIALRMRASTISATLGLAVYYGESWDGQSSTRPSAALPPAANSIAVTPNASAWANSAFAELSSSIPVKAGLGYIAVNNGVATVDFEIDLATGGSGSETVRTTLRGSALSTQNGGGALIRQALPAVYEVAKNSRVSYRLRKTGTDVTQWAIAAGYYELTGGGKGSGGKNKGNPGTNFFEPGGAIIVNIGNPGISYTY